jgi:segregation and condensation protein B
MEELNLDSQIEAVLFWKGEPQSIKKLAANLGRKEDEIKTALEVLKEKIKDRGVELILKDDEVMLGTASKLSHIIERLTKEELVRDLGKAGLETISIIAYKGPISRAEIDYIRGVQSNFILRNLQIRGLVEKIVNEKDHRSFLYKPTFELLSFLGVSKIEDLPEYEKVKAEFSLYETQNKAVEPVEGEKGILLEEAPEDITEETDNTKNI